MPLTMRPTGLSSPIDQHWMDYTVYSGEWPVGRIWHHPPTSKSHDRPDFHRGLGLARRFARKGREIADRPRRLGRFEGRRAERGLGASGKPGADVTPAR